MRKSEGTYLEIGRYRWTGWRATAVLIGLIYFVVFAVLAIIYGFKVLS